MYEINKFWSFTKYNTNINKPKYIKHLKDLKCESKIDFIRAIKISDVFFNQNVRNETIQNVLEILDEDNDSCILDFKSQLEVLKQLKSKIDDNKEQELKNFVSNYHSEIFIKFIDIFLFDVQVELISNKQFETVSDVVENTTNICSNVINELLADGNFVANNIMNEKAYKDSLCLYLVFKDAYLWKLVKDAWRFSDISIEMIGSSLKIKEIGKFGKYKLKSQQNFFDIKNSRDLGYNYNAINNNWINNIDDYLKKYVPSKKEQFKKQIEEYFYTDDFSQKYLGKPLETWIELYWEIYTESVKITIKDNLKSREQKNQYIKNGGLTKRYNRKDLKKIIKNNKILKNKPYGEMIDLFLLNNHSYQTLQNYPLIQINQQYFLNSQVSIYTDYSRTILNLLIDSRAEELTLKGKNFEKYLEELLSSRLRNNVLVNELRREETEDKSKTETYEVDLITYIDKTIVFIEAKTQQIPEEYGDYYKLLKQENEYLVKFKRNTDYFVNNIKTVLDKLGLNINIDELDYKRIFVSNVTPTTEKNSDGIFLMDELNFYNFFKGIQPKVIEFKNNSPKFYVDEKNSYLFNGEITVNKLTDFLNKDNVDLYENIDTRIDYVSNRFSKAYKVDFQGVTDKVIDEICLFTLAPPKIKKRERDVEKDNELKNVNSRKLDIVSLIKHKVNYFIKKILK